MDRKTIFRICTREKAERSKQKHSVRQRERKMKKDGSGSGERARVRSNQGGSLSDRLCDSACSTGSDWWISHALCWYYISRESASFDPVTWGLLIVLPLFHALDLLFSRGQKQECGEPQSMSQTANRSCKCPPADRTRDHQGPVTGPPIIRSIRCD